MKKRISSLMLFFPLLANAGGLDKLKDFFQNTSSMRAQFHQVVIDNQGKKVQEVNGSLQLLRPGKFRWDYNKPFPQEIVGDGEKVWLFDPELNQVTVRALTKALGSSPAALLSGSQDMEKSFNLKDQHRKDALEWVLATPKVEESGFERVLLGFNANSLQAMELYDSFGHTTFVTFSKMELNPKLSPAIFQFKPPAGADITGE